MTLIAGSRFTTGQGDPIVWPHDGIVAVHSALARDVAENALPERRELVFPDTHGILISSAVGLPRQTGLTWDPAVLEAVAEAIQSA